MPSKEQPFENDLNFQLPAEQIRKLTDSIIDRLKKTYDQVGSLKDEEVNWNNTVQVLSDLQGVSTTLGSNVEFPQYVSSEKDIRDASVEADTKIDHVKVELGMREDVYRRLVDLKNSVPDSALNPIQKRLLNKYIEDFERNGLALPKNKRDILAELKKEMSDCCIQFSKNMNEETTKLPFKREELEGLSDDFIEGLQKDEDGNYLVSLKYPDLLPVMDLCKVAETRRKMDEANGKKCMKENVPLIEKAIKLRAKIAKMVGFETHSDFILDVRMAKSRKNVQDFLSRLSSKLTPLANEELQMLLSLKKKECEERGVPFDGIINSHDFRYYHTMSLKLNYSVDHELIKQYFPMEHVTSAMLKIYEELFGVEFKIEPTENRWHEDVIMYKVFDRNNAKAMGTFYLDLHPRDGKYGHAAVFPLQPRREAGDAPDLPVCAMVANFSKPSPSKPSLLKHDEVVTLFHEFGHVMHNICTVSPYPRFSGTSVERDFVEAPSQMLENWCYEKDILNRLSKHFETGKSLPDDIILKLIKAKNATTGLLNRRQIFFATFDQTVHSVDEFTEVDTEKLWSTLKPSISLIPHQINTNPAASFGHLMGGYDAQYYGYLYSEVFSSDLFDQFHKHGVLNPDMGKKYRDEILAPGGCRDSIESLKIFLGRNPNEEAFLRHIGITNS